MSVDLRAAVGFMAGHARTLDRHRLNLILGQGDRAAALCGRGRLSQPGRWVRLGTRTGSSLGNQPTWRSAACLRSLCRHRNADAQSGRTVRLVADQFAGRRRFAVRLPDRRPGRLCALLGEMRIRWRRRCRSPASCVLQRLALPNSTRPSPNIRGSPLPFDIASTRSTGRILCMPSSWPLPCSFSTRFTGTVPKRRRW